MDWWAMNFTAEHLQMATGVSCWLMIRWDALRLKHLDNKTQSLRHSQIATSFVGRQLTFTPTDFSSQSFEVGGKGGERGGRGGGGGRGTRHCQPLLTCSSIHLLGSKLLIIILISLPPLQSTPIDSCPLIHKLLTEEGAADIFTSFLYKKRKKKEMTVCWWYYPISHSCVSRLSGRQCAGFQLRLLIAVFLFTHQNTEQHPQ